jgi:hypothetical protein
VWPLPFQDSLGHDGVIGALRWAVVDPGALSPELELGGLVGPNRLFYLVPTVLGVALGPELGIRLGYAVNLATVGPLVALGLRFAGRRPAWALAVAPIVLGRLLASGFVPNVYALGFLGLVLGLIARAPRRGEEAALLPTAAVLTFAAHAFVGLVGAGFLLLSAALDLVRGPRRLGALALASALLVLGLHVLTAVPGHGGGEGAAAALLAAVHGPDFGRLPRALEWSGAWQLRQTWDDAIHGVWMAGLLGGALLGPRRDAATAKLGLCLLAAVAVGLTLDERIGPPVNWWGGWLRIPAIGGLVTLYLAAGSTSPWARAPLAAAAGAAQAFVLGSVAHVGEVAAHEYRGLSEVLDAAPRERRVCALWFGEDAKLHGYPGLPHWYAGNIYLARKGGAVAHGLFDNPAVPVHRRSSVVRQPPSGMAWVFDAEQHRGWCELFLVRIDPRAPDRPFRPEVRASLRLLAEAGAWRLWADPRGRTAPPLAR